MNRLITSKEIPVGIRKLPTNKNPELDDFIGEIYQTFFKKLVPILLKLFQKIGEKGKLPNSFYETIIILTPQSDIDTTKKENYGPISMMNIDAKNPQQNISKFKPNNTLTKSSSTTK